VRRSEMYQGFRLEDCGMFTKADWRTFQQVATAASFSAMLRDTTLSILRQHSASHGCLAQPITLRCLVDIVLGCRYAAANTCMQCTFIAQEGIHG